MIITYFILNDTTSVDNFFDSAEEKAISDILEMEREAYAPFREKIETVDFTDFDREVLYRSREYLDQMRGPNLKQAEDALNYLSCALFWCNAGRALTRMRRGIAESEDRKLADIALQLAMAHVKAGRYFNESEKDSVDEVPAKLPDECRAMVLIEDRSADYFYPSTDDESDEPDGSLTAAAAERYANDPTERDAMKAYLETTQILCQEFRDGEENVSEEAIASKKRYAEKFLPSMARFCSTRRRMRFLDRQRLKSSRQSFSIRRCRSRTHRVIIRAARSGQGTDSATDNGGGSEPPDQRHKRPP